MADVIDGITGVILVGGKSRRMGRDKAFIPWEGRPLFEKVLHLFRDSFRDVVLVGNHEERFADYDVPVLRDLYPGSALAGVYTGLYHARTERIFVAPCDMPYPSRELLRNLCQVSDGYDVVVPRSAQALEPLFAIYAKHCLEPMKEMLENGELKVYDLYPRVKVRYLAGDELTRGGGTPFSLVNVNTPEEVASLAPSSPGFRP
jgi:molybdenum cofactor guanylyltransferase